jgi:hypothetical protein
MLRKKISRCGRLLSILTEIYEENNVIDLKDRKSELINYCEPNTPVKKDIAQFRN